MSRQKHSRTDAGRAATPRYSFDCWSEIHRQIRRARQVAFFTDFDGTLTPIRRYPEAVGLSPRVRRLLEQIARTGMVVGVVSGRKVADVRKRVRVSGIWYAGAHGLFLRDPHNRSFSLATPEQKARIRAATRLLAKHIRGAPGLRLERKVATVALHYRGAPASSQRIARDAVGKVMERYPSLCLLSSKKVWGLLPDAESDKWGAISFILSRERRGRPGGRLLTIFIGDDATDERVFERMSGISIAVGKRNRTAARFYLRSPAEVRKFLERLNETQR
jgi:trehalose-phosphatase